jgi:hypothetical protein
MKKHYFELKCLLTSFLITNTFVYNFYLSDGKILYSVSCGLSAAPGTTGTGTNRQRPTLTGLDRHKTDTDRPGLFYDVFDKNFQNIMPFWAI